MDRSERNDILDRLNYLFNEEDKRLEEKRQRQLQLKHEEKDRKRKIKVKNIFDLKEKYENYDVDVNSFTKVVSIKKPLEVKYLPQFRYECNYLGFKCEIGNRSIEDLYYNNYYM